MGVDAETEVADVISSIQTIVASELTNLQQQQQNQQQQQQPESQPEDLTTSTDENIVFVVMANIDPTPSSIEVEQTSIEPISSPGRRESVIYNQIESECNPLYEAEEESEIYTSTPASSSEEMLTTTMQPEDELCSETEMDAAGGNAEKEEESPLCDTNDDVEHDIKEIPQTEQDEVHDVNGMINSCRCMMMGEFSYRLLNSSISMNNMNNTKKYV